MKWTQEQRIKAGDFVITIQCHANTDGALWTAAVELACQRNELLEALKLCVENIESSFPDDEFTLELISNAQSAIAKVESL